MMKADVGAPVGGDQLDPAPRPATTVAICWQIETNAAGYSGRWPTTRRQRQPQKKRRVLSRSRTLKPT